jgi:hypothetical protein
MVMVPIEPVVQIEPPGQVPPGQIVPVWQTVIVVCVTHWNVTAIVQPMQGLVMCVQPQATPHELGMQVAVDWSAASGATPHEFGMHVAVDWNAAAFAAGDTPHEVGWHAAAMGDTPHEVGKHPGWCVNPNGVQTGPGPVYM